MLDIVPAAKVVLVAALIAAAVMWLAARRAPRAWRRVACWSWATGAGVLAASGATDQWPHWPALEDRARFLTLLVPLALVGETLVATMRSGSLAWIVRLGLATIVAPILLHNTVYLADLSGPDSAEWSPTQAAIVLCGLAALLTLVWGTMSRLQARTSTSAVLWVLVLDALATAAAVMLSGYYRGGLLGLGLAGALAGATLASYATQPQWPTSGSLGMAVIGIFSVVVMGRFFGTLPTSLAACLLVAPLLAWIVELPPLGRLAPIWRGAGRLICVAAPLMAVVIVAQREFAAASKARSTSPGLRSPAERWRGGMPDG
ncbi:MAG: hypothetical protein HYX69_20060 [Planctomycetia bacterium]|nr:hypothetical protein [Planctomycetia bacterium]